MEGDNRWQLQCVNKMALFSHSLIHLGWPMSAPCFLIQCESNVTKLPPLTAACFFIMLWKEIGKHTQDGFPTLQGINYQEKWCSYKHDTDHASKDYFCIFQCLLLSKVQFSDAFSTLDHLSLSIKIQNIVVSNAQHKILDFLEIRLRFKWFNPRILTLSQPLMSSFIWWRKKPLLYFGVYFRITCYFI